MLKISFNEVTKYYGANLILDKLSFDIHEGEVVGILGTNGAGKSTIFKLLSSAEPYESGQIAISKEAKIGLLEQLPVVEASVTVREFLQEAFGELYAIKKQMVLIEEQMRQQESEALLERYGRLQVLFEHGDGYFVEDKISQICESMNIDEDFQKRFFMQLSGGEKTRACLARILLEEVNVLLLDEPTNHLDLETIEWLERFLERFKGVVVIVSHDRYFLDQTVHRIMELKNGTIEHYGGGYTFYTAEKEMRFEQQQNQYEKNQKKIKQLEAAAKRLRIWAKIGDNEKLYKQAVNIERRIEKMPKVEKPVKDREIKQAFELSEKRSKEILTLQDVAKMYGDNCVFKGLSGQIFYKDRVAVLGENGSGKTTLLKAIVGEISVDSGNVALAPSVSMAYLPQEIEFESPKMTVIEFLMNELSLTSGKARAVLAAYHFRSEMIEKLIGRLSGGEKTRLMLSVMMEKSVNLLILDEPTNHLDLKSREWVENAIDDYEGTVIFVSHDRHFINKFAEKIWWLESGKITVIDGDYEAYKAYKSKMLNESLHHKKSFNEPIVNESRHPESVSQNQENPKAVQRKNTFMIEKLEGEIETLEQVLEKIEREIELNVDDYQLIQLKLEEKRQVELEMAQIYERWEQYV